MNFCKKQFIWKLKHLEKVMLYYQGESVCLVNTCKPIGFTRVACKPILYIYIYIFWGYLYIFYINKLIYIYNISYMIHIFIS